MVTLRYAPKRGGSYFAPTLRPGETITVTNQEAQALTATGVFERIDADPAPEVAASEPKPPKRPRERKE